jgi:phage RecT family recombinase
MMQEGRRGNGGPDPRSVELDRLFRDRWKELIALFPDDGKARVMRARASAQNSLRRSELKSVNVESLATAVLGAHHLGLEIGDQAYVVPYKAAAQLIIGPRGLIALAYRAGFVRAVEARCVFEGDDFDYDFGAGSLRHRKVEQGRRPPNRKPEDLITHAYCTISTTTGGRVIEVLTAEDLRFYRGFSKASSGPWFDNFEGMGRKTAIKRGLEFVPRNALLSAALRETDEGGYTIPDEVMAAVRGRVPDEFVPPEEPQVERLQAQAPAQQQGAPMRQPGEDED